MRSRSSKQPKTTAPAPSAGSERFAHLFTLEVPPRLVRVQCPEPYQDYWVELQLNVPPAKVAALGDQYRLADLLALLIHDWNFRARNAETGAVGKAAITGDVLVGAPNDLLTWLNEEWGAAAAVPLARSTPTVPLAASTPATSNGSGTNGP